MALFNGFTFDGVNSLDYGIYITGEGVYNAPERAVEMVEIQGRNGALAIDQGRWDNIEVTYHCGCFGADQADFAERIGRFRNAICSRTSYCRLTDDYHPDEYRLALYHAGVEVDHVRRAGEFDLIFDCKPQRFLTSGEDTITVGDWGDVTEYSGDVVSFEGDEMTAVKSLSISLSPVQNLNGYDHPWVGGAGKNKLPAPTASTQSINGITWTINEDGSITARGTATARSILYYLPSGDYGIINTNVKGTLFDKNGNVLPATQDSVYTGIQIDDRWGGFNSDPLLGNGTLKQVWFSIDTLNVAVDYTIFPILYDASLSVSAWEPYENICPISGWDGVSVTRAGKNLAISQSNNSVIGHATRGKTYTISWSGDYKFHVKKNTTSGDYVVVAATSPVTFTADDDYNIYLNGWSVGSEPLSNIQLELGSTATAYEPYQGATYTQEFKDSQGNTLTVYGGESEIVGGVLTVTRAIYEFTANDVWAKYETAGKITFNSRDRFPVGIDTSKPCIMSNYPFIKAAYIAAQPDKSFSVFSAPLLSVCDSGYSDASTFASAMAGNQLVYYLATPITYTLTSQQVETLIGTNNIWSDAGEVTVEIADDPNKIVNPTLYDAKPLIKVSGYGTVQVGSATITIEGSASDVTYIDCDSMECYRLNGLAIVSANSAVSFSSYDFPVLEADAITGITYSTNISQVQIVPRWWQL